MTQPANDRVCETYVGAVVGATWILTVDCRAENLASIRAALGQPEPAPSARVIDLASQRAARKASGSAR
jgi:hypothetical protein